MLAMTLAPLTLPAALASVLDEASLQRLHELDPQGANRVVERVLRAFEASLTRLLPQSPQALARRATETAAPCGAHAEVVFGQRRRLRAVAVAAARSRTACACCRPTAWPKGWPR